MKGVRELFNEVKIIFDEKKQRRSEKNAQKGMSIKHYQKKNNLTKIERKVQKNIVKYIKNLEKLQKYRYNITYGLKYLFNDEENYYEPIEIKSAVDGSYVEYESRGDRKAMLSLDEYLNTIIPYLRDMIDDHKARGEWKIQLTMKINFFFLLFIVHKFKKCIQKALIKKL